MFYMSKAVKSKTAKEKVARNNILKKSAEISGVAIRGYDFNKGVDYSAIVKSFGSSGYQATHLARAIKIVDRMIDEKAHIFLGYTSNMVSSGLRDVFRYLVEHRKVDAVVTTASTFLCSTKYLKTSLKPELTMFDV